MIKKLVTFAPYMVMAEVEEIDLSDATQSNPYVGEADETCSFEAMSILDNVQDEDVTDKWQFHEPCACFATPNEQGWWMADFA